jgi:hypothetical protein
MATRSARDDPAGALASRHAHRSSGSDRARHAPSGRPCALVIAEHGREAGGPRAIPALPRCPPPSPPSMSCSDQPRMRRPSATIALELSAARFAARTHLWLGASGVFAGDGAQPVRDAHGTAGHALASGALMRAHDTPGGLAVGLRNAHAVSVVERHAVCDARPRPGTPASLAMRVEADRSARATGPAPRGLGGGRHGALAGCGRSRRLRVAGLAGGAVGGGL